MSNQQHCGSYPKSCESKKEHGGHCKNRKRNRKQKNCQCFPPCGTYCNILSLSLTKIATPTIYTAVGTVITYTYTIKNTGTVVICGPTQICDDKLGTIYGQSVYLCPGAIQTLTSTYTITPNDLLLSNITNTATAYVYHDCKWVCSEPISFTITNGSADVFGTITQTLSAGVVSVDVTLYNAVTSTTAASNVSLVLPFPANVTVLTVSGPNFVVDQIARTITITYPTINVGTSAAPAINFTYVPLVSGSYLWAGTITSTSYDPFPGNNVVANNLIVNLP